MLFKRLLPAAFAAVASARSLTTALSSQNASLSILISLLEMQLALISVLGSASNIIILAPNITGLATLLNSSTGTTMPEPVTALLTYPVLNGTYPASAFTSTL